MPGWLLIFGRVALGAVFLYAAYTKLRQPWVLFAMSIQSYQVLPDGAVTLLARALPWFELLLGLWLVAGVALRYAAGLASAVLLGFFAVMLRAYFKGMTIDCGCFGFGEALGPATLTRDGVLVLLSLVLFWAAVRTARAPHAEAAAS
jgi:uncharacterized membrane protein YphA (DoxX/SURF4 family)